MTEPAPVSATVRRMLVGAQLRRLREDKGITRAEAGYTIRASESKMSRLELGRVAFKERDVSDLLMLYGVTNPEARDAVLALLEDANRPGWWREYEDVMPGWFQNYVGLEAAAQILRTYETHFVPGLLQTPEYARAVLASTTPPLSGPGPGPGSHAADHAPAGPQPTRPATGLGGRRRVGAASGGRRP